MVGRVGGGTALVVLANFIVFARPARPQDFLSIYRSEEVGTRELDMNEETFLNLLSFSQPIETLQPFYAAGSGWYTALGSLTNELLWYQTDVKLTAPIGDWFSAQAYLRNSIDFDTEFTQVQLVPEAKLSDTFYAGFVAVLDFDKGRHDYGIETTWRDPANELDYLRLSWVRSDAIFDSNSDDFPRSEYREPADNFEIQMQGNVLGIGKTTILVADQVPSELEYVGTQHIEKFSRFHARLLQAIDWTPTQRFFVEGAYEIASESSTPTGPAGDDLRFEGDRDYLSARIEYQHDLSTEDTSRLRGGVQYVYFREDAEKPLPSPYDTTNLRNERILYAGWRVPVLGSKDVDLETVVWLDFPNSVQRRRAAMETIHFRSFQGKISFFLTWHVAGKADFVLAPSFELDRGGWGGGVVQLRYRF